MKPLIDDYVFTHAVIAVFLQKGFVLGAVVFITLLVSVVVLFTILRKWGEGY